MNGVWIFEAWNQVGHTLPDLSFEANAYGAIPLECPGVTKLARRCKTKLYDGLPIKTKKGSKKMINVHCKICDFSGVRVRGKMK